MKARFNVIRKGGLVQRGFALGELLLAVAVVGILVTIGYGIYNSLTKDTAAQDLTQKSVAMIGKIKSIYGNAGTFSGITGQAVDQLGARPDGFRLSGTDLVDNFGNVIDVNGAAAFFGMRFQGLTKDTCGKIASGLAGLAYQVTVGSASAVSVAAGVITGGTDYKAAGGTPNTANLATGCGAAEPLAVAVQIR